MSNSPFVRYYLIWLAAIFATLDSAGQNDRPRSQEPQEPYPYLSEDVIFQNKEANIHLSGTLTLPIDKTDFPVVILISGSSPHNRNEEIAGHKPFLVIADYLTRNGIGVLRYDDRGVGKSGGNYEIAAYDDRASDVESAITYLKMHKKVSSDRIGLMGHSEGGLIASIVASSSKELSFIVLLATAGLPGYDIVLLQTEQTNRAKGINEDKTQAELAFLKVIFDAVVATNDLPSVKSDLSRLLKNTDLPEGVRLDDIDGILEVFTAEWFQKILRYNPGISLEQVDCPVLALAGEKDLQIPPRQNLDAIRSALYKGGNKQVSIKELPGLNHLFQEAQTGLSEEFETIEQTFSPIALLEILSFIKEVK